MAATTPVEQGEVGKEEVDSDESDSLLECLSCNEQEGYLVNPKTLQCKHTFCVSCLANHCVDDVITCYKCGEKTVGSIEDLPSALTKPTFCGTCEKIDKVQYKTANMYCVACDVKFCATHVKVHSMLVNHHPMLTIQNYLKSSYALELRFCETHKDRILSLGCCKCWMITCPKCISSNPTCDQGKGALGNHHNLVSIEEVAENMRAELEPVKTAAEDQFDEIAALVKEITILLSDWDTETEHAVRLIHDTRDQQLTAIQVNYDKLELDYTENRKACKEKITSYIAESAGPKMSDVLDDIKTLRSDLSDLHPVDLVRERTEIEKRINEMLAEDFPLLILSSQTKPSQTDAEKRELEIELFPVADSIFGDNIGEIFKTPPSTLELVREAIVGACPSSVCHYKGYTYVGKTNGTIDRVDYQGNVNASFINQGYSDIICVRAQQDELYVLVSGTPHTVYIHDLSGQKLRSWKHPDSGGAHWGGNMAFVNNQLIIANSSNKQILINSVADGKVTKTILCPQISSNIAICAGAHDSVVISDYGTSKVFKLNLTTEVIEWTSTRIHHPGGVTLLGHHYVAVACYGSKIWLLCLRTGEVVKELTDAAMSNTTYVFDIYLNGDTLIIPRYGEYKVQHYKLK